MIDKISNFNLNAVSPRANDAFEANRNLNKFDVSKNLVESKAQPKEKEASFVNQLNSKSTASANKQTEIRDSKKLEQEPNQLNSKLTANENKKTEARDAIRAEQEPSQLEYKTNENLESKTVDYNTNQTIYDKSKINSVSLKQPKVVNKVEENYEDLQLVGNINNDQQPVLDFMRFMKSEYGIQPEEIVEAMNNLNDLQLMSTPQESMVAFFQNLQIPPEKMGPAKDQYLKMLSDLDKIQLAKQIKNQEPTVEVIDVKKQKYAEINRKIDQMNASFFMKPGAESIKMGQVSDPITNDLALEAQGTYKTAGSEAAVKQVANPKPFFAEEKIYSPTQQNNTIPKQGIEVHKQEQPNLNAMALTGFSATPEVEKQSSLLSDSESSNKTLQDLNKLTEKLGSQIKALENSLPQSESESADYSDLDSTYDTLTQTPDAQVDKTVSAGAFTSELNASENKNEKNPNIQNILNHSQVMIRKGGGEMKLQLQPEGLGNVSLKVKVENGKVGVQMIADTADAKRLLENSIGDLRAQLSQHKLAIDTFKVDVSDKFQNMNQQTDLNREDARNFLGQFRDQNESFRQGMFGEAPGMKAYRSLNGQQPVSRPQESQTIYNSRGNDKGRIHLVA